MSDRVLYFAKMQALGNDFVVLDGVRQKITLSSDIIQKWADRHFGIGFDQLLLIEPPQNTQADFHYRIFNADGQEVSQCGNGARCVAKFVRERGLTSKKNIIFQTHRGLIECHLKDNNDVRVSLGIPEWQPSKIPFIAKTSQILYTLKIDSFEKKFEVCPVSIGNPHCVLWVESFEDTAIQEVGAQLSKHESFPDETNVEFTKIIDRQTISLRVFERGVGETLACGSAACAAMLASKRLNLVDDSVKIIMPGGELRIDWQGDGTPVWLTGPAEFVFDGELIHPIS